MEIPLTKLLSNKSIEKELSIIYFINKFEIKCQRIMKLKDFLKKYNISLNEQELGLCEKAIKIMSLAKDVAHDQDHVYSILDVLDEFMQTNEYKNECRKCNLNELLLAICWHDVWRSTKYPGNLFSFLWSLSWDGMGSSLMFWQAARKAKLDKKTRLSVFYAIRKHSYFQYFPIFGHVARLLYDLDNYDNFNYRRLNKLKKKIYGEKERLSWGRARMARWGLGFIKKFNLDISITYDWFKRGFKKRKQKFVEEAEAVIRGYEDILRNNKK